MLLLQLEDSLQEHASAAGQRNEQLRQQSSAEIDFEEMLPTTVKQGGAS